MATRAPFVFFLLELFLWLAPLTMAIQVKMNAAEEKVKNLQQMNVPLIWCSTPFEPKVLIWRYSYGHESGWGV
jgi:hypothetical protein